MPCKLGAAPPNPVSDGKPGRSVTSLVQNPQEGLTADFYARMRWTALLLLCAYRGEKPLRIAPKHDRKQKGLLLIVDD